MVVGFPRAVHEENNEKNHFKHEINAIDHDERLLALAVRVALVGNLELLVPEAGGGEGEAVIRALSFGSCACVCGKRWSCVPYTLARTYGGKKRTHAHTRMRERRHIHTHTYLYVSSL